MSNEGDYEALEKSIRYIPWEERRKNGTRGTRHFWLGQ